MYYKYSIYRIIVYPAPIGIIGGGGNLISDEVVVT